MWGRTQYAAACIGTSLVLPGAAVAQYQNDFEGFDASPSGTNLIGQGGYYQPVAGSTDPDVYTYTGNALGLPQNPTGGENFVGGMWPGGDAFVRGQLDFPWGTGVWEVSFDIAATFLGDLPAVQNIGSVSIQPFPGSQSMIALARWTDPSDPTTWDADYVWFSAAGTQLIEKVPDPGFQGLATNHWYRWTTAVDLDTNRIFKVSITDLTTMDTVTHQPADRYLMGGSAGNATPTGYRLFVGGSGLTQFGNALGFDNVLIDAADPCPPDWNGDGVVDSDDLFDFLSDWAAGC